MRKSVEEFEELLSRKGKSSKTFASPIEVDPGEFRGGLELKDRHFRGRLTLRGCTFGNDVVIRNCVFDDGIELSGAEFAGRFVFVGGTLKVVDPELAAPLVLEFASCDSDLEVAGTQIEGSMMARGCRVNGSLRLTSTTIKGLNAPLLDLSHAHIDGDVVVGGEPSVFVKNLVAKSTDEEAPVVGDIPGVKFEAKDTSSVALKLVLTTVDGTVSISGIKCVGSVDTTYGRFGIFHIERADIDGDLTLSGAIIGFVEMTGLSLTGTLMMITGRTGQFNIDSSSDVVTPIPTKVGALVYVGCTCSDWVRFGISVIGPVGGRSGTFGLRGVKIANCNIAGDVDFLCGVAPMRQFANIPKEVGPDDPRRLICNPFLYGLKTNDPISITACTIGGHLDLTNVNTADVIDLSDCTVVNSIRFTSPLSARAAKAGKDEIRKALILLGCAIRREDLKEEHDHAMTATARRLHLERTKAGAIDLTGLRLTAVGSEDGSVLASHAVVERELQVARRVTADEQEHFIEGLRNIAGKNKTIADLLDTTLRQCLVPSVANKIGASGGLFGAYLRLVGLEGPKPGGTFSSTSAWAVIPGALKLDNAKIGLLRLARESFEFDQKAQPDSDNQPKGADQPKGIVLDDATIGVLRIHRPLSAQDDDNGFPRPIQMPGVTIASWRLGEERTSGKTPPAPGTASDGGDEILESSHSGPYLDVLDNDKEYRASNYLAVERSLRNRGHDQAANEVFIAGRYRSQRGHLKVGPYRWEAGQGRLNRKRTFLRMTRSPNDGRQSIAGIAGFVAILGLVVFGTPLLLKCPAFGWKGLTGLAVVALSLAFGFLLFGPFRDSVLRLLDRMYWSLVDYGTSTRRLMAVIVLLAIPSFVLVATNSKNFEPTAAVYLAAADAAERAPVQQEPNQTPAEREPEDPNSGPEPAFVNPCTEDNWRAGEAFWMTLRYHIPLAALGVMDKCQPKDHDLHIWGWSVPYLEARDWFGLMAILNYILWPLFIPFLVRRFWRVERQG